MGKDKKPSQYSQLEGEEKRITFRHLQHQDEISLEDVVACEKYHMVGLEESINALNSRLAKLGNVINDFVTNWEQGTIDIKDPKTYHVCAAMWSDPTVHRELFLSTRTLLAETLFHITSMEAVVKAVIYAPQYQEARDKVKS